MNQMHGLKNLNLMVVQKSKIAQIFRTIRIPKNTKEWIVFQVNTPLLIKLFLLEISGETSGLKLRWEMFEIPDETKLKEQ